MLPASSASTTLPPGGVRSNTGRVTGRRVGGRLGRKRRNRVAYLALLRRSSDHVMRAGIARTVYLVVIAAGSVVSERRLLALAICAIAAGGNYLLWNNERHIRRGTVPRFWLASIYMENVSSTDGRHRLSLGSYIDLPCAFLLTAVPAWVARDVPLGLRLLMLAAAVMFVISTVMLIFNDHTWFNPDETTPPVWHEVARLLSGLVVALPIGAIVLPGFWGREGFAAALILVLLAFTISIRIADVDQLVKVLPRLVAEEAHAGRELVISETHGALSTNLRLIEQQAREIRSIAPSLYELAVSANSRLRETLTLSHVGSDSSTGMETLAAPVFTLARAVGAKAEVDVRIASISPADRDLARLILSDLVGNALNAGAGAISVTIAEVDQLAAISVTDDAPPMAPGVWKTPDTSSARLEARLAGLSGSLTEVQQAGTKTVTARWMATYE
jgi:signal transduction histidine kinase